jgi:hypothetical protein
MRRAVQTGANIKIRSVSDGQQVAEKVRNLKLEVRRQKFKVVMQDVSRILLTSTFELFTSGCVFSAACLGPHAN